MIALLLKGHGNEPNFPRFLHKSLWPRSLALHFKPFQFWLRILGDIPIQKRLLVSVNRGVVDSPTQRYGESATLRINNKRSRRLPDSTIRGVSASPYQRYAELTTLRITDTASLLLKNSIPTLRIGDAGSRRLRVAVTRRVVDSPYR